MMGEPDAPVREPYDAKRSARATADRMRAVAAAASGMLGARSLGDLKDIVRQACEEVVPFDAFTFGLYDEPAGDLQYLGTVDEGFVEGSSRYPVAGTPSEQVIAERRSLLTLSVADPRAAGAFLMGTMRRSESIIRTPILSLDGVLGVISVQSYTPGAYSAEDVAVVETVAAVAATALQNLRLLEERDRDQHAFLVQQAYLEELFRASPEAVVVLDNTDRVIRINPEFSRMFGYDEADAVGRPINQLVAPEHLRSSSIELTERVAAGETVNVETVRRRSDGSLLNVSILGTPIRVSGSQVAVYGIYRDITARKEAEARLGNRERYFRSLIENTSDVIAVVEGDGMFRYLSPAVRHVLGYAPGELLGRPVYGLMSDDDAAVVRVAFRRALGEPDATFVAEARFRHADGSWRLLALTGHDLLDDPAVKGVVVNMRDLTEARARDAQLRRVERLASLGTLIGGVAHELNNPLAAIKGFTELMLMNEQPPEDREALETIAREAKRAADIVADLRVLARETQEQAVMGPVDLNEAVRHVLKLRRYSLDTNNILACEDLDPALRHVWGDRGQLEQVVLNLVVNAEQALDEHDGERRLAVRTRAAGDTAILEVIDSGPGIRATDLERIFDPFWTTKAPGVGTGLGLSLVHNILTEQGGSIHVASEPGRGARFTVELVAAPPPETSPVPLAQSPLTAAVRPSLRVLLVDDEPGIRVSLARFLERRGHHVDVAAEGEEALRLLDEPTTDPFDLVVSDLRMPGLPGEQLLQRLLERDPDWTRRIVFITGDAANPRTAAAIGHVPVVLKPFDLAALAELLEARVAEYSESPVGR